LKLGRNSDVGEDDGNDDDGALESDAGAVVVSRIGVSSSSFSASKFREADFVFRMADDGGFVSDGADADSALAETEIVLAYALPAARIAEVAVILPAAGVGLDAC
jgi:hypothetical protein